MDYLQHKNDPAEIAEVFDEVTMWASRFGALLFDNIEMRPGLRILDIGCATGFPLFELAEMHGPSCSAIGIDVWLDTFQRALARKRVYGQGNVEVVGADASFLPFANQTFDLIVSNLGINNFADPPQVLAECYRVSRPNARIVLTTNLTGHMSEFYGLYRDALKELGLHHRLSALETQEEHRGSAASVGTWLQAAGFRVVRTVEDSFSMRFLDSAAFFNHHLIKVGFLDGWRGVLAREEEEWVFRALENALDRLASQEGEIRLTIPMLHIEAEK